MFIYGKLGKHLTAICWVTILACIVSESGMWSKISLPAHNEALLQERIALDLGLSQQRETTSQMDAASLSIRSNKPLEAQGIQVLYLDNSHVANNVNYQTETTNSDSPAALSTLNVLAMAVRSL